MLVMMGSENGIFKVKVMKIGPKTISKIRYKKFWKVINLFFNGLLYINIKFGMIMGINTKNIKLNEPA